MSCDELSVFHLHPLQRCNLRCLHCYSESSPQASATLPLPLALHAVTLAARWGYRSLALSGGEPLLYPGLATLLEHGKHVGLSTSLVTNGLLCRTVEQIGKLRHADTVTVSLDGLAKQHDHMRGRVGAFAGAADAVRRLADAGINTWVACSVGASNVGDIEEIAALAACWGAQGIAFHLVEPAGRAANLSRDAFLSGDERELLYVTAALLAALQRTSIAIRVDLLHRDIILKQPSLIYAPPGKPCNSTPSSTIRVLIMYPDGRLIPICHGFHDRFALGRLDHNIDPTRMWDTFLGQTYPAITALGQAALDELRRDESIRVLNPGDWLAERSHAFPSIASG